MRRLNTTLIAEGLSAEARARKMCYLRNTLRSWTRDLMHNRGDAEYLTRYEQNSSFDRLVARHEAEGRTGEAAYEAIIESSTKSRPAMNGEIDPNNPPPLSPVWPAFPIWGQATLKKPSSPTKPPPPVGDNGF